MNLLIYKTFKILYPFKTFNVTFIINENDPNIIFVTGGCKKSAVRGYISLPHKKILHELALASSMFY